MRNLTKAIMTLLLVAFTACSSAEAMTTQRSLETIAQAVQQNPNDLDLRREMVRALIAQGQTVKAAQQMQLLIKSGAATSSDWATLGEALRYNANYRDAVKAYTEALKISPMNSEALGGMAMAYASAGQFGYAMNLVKTGLSQTYNAHDRQYLLSTFASIKNMTALASAPTGSVTQ